MKLKLGSHSSHKLRQLVYQFELSQNLSGRTDYYDSKSLEVLTELEVSSKKHWFKCKTAI